MLGITLIVSLFFSSSIAFYSDLYSYPPYSGFLQHGNSGENRTFFLIQPSDINTIVSNFAGFTKNHTIKLASISVDLHSHVIYRGNSVLALCSIDDETFLKSHGANLFCDFNLSYQNNIISRANCTIGIKVSKCVAEIYPDPHSILISADFISLDLNYNVTAFDNRTFARLEEVTNSLIYKSRQLPTIYQINPPENVQKTLGNGALVFQVPSQTKERNFFLDLILKNALDRFYFELNLPSPVEYITTISSNVEVWNVQVNQIAHGILAFNITNQKSQDEAIESLHIQIELKISPKLGFRQKDMIITNQKILPDTLQDLNNKFSLKTPRIIPDRKSLYIFTQFQSSDSVQLPWKSTIELQQPRKLNVIGYIPNERKFLDLNEKIHCRIAKNKLGSSKNSLLPRYSHFDSFSPCPQEMRLSNEEVEYPLPSSENPLSNKDNAFGTGLEFHEQLVLSLGPIGHNVVPDPMFGYPENSDWSWRVWRGPYLRIWNVDQVTVELERNHLEQVENWWYPSNDKDHLLTCLPGYENSRIIVKGRMYLTRLMNGEKIPMTGSDPSSFIDLTRYVTKESLVIITENQNEAVADLYWSKTSNLPFIVGRQPGKGQITLVRHDGGTISSQGFAVGAKKPKSVVSMEVLCANPEVTLSGTLNDHHILSTQDSNTQFSYPLTQKLALTPERELLRPVLFSYRDRNLIKDVYDNQNDNGIVVTNPGLTFNDSCEVNKVMVNLIFSDDTKLSVANVKENELRLIAKMKADHRLTWDPARNIVEDVENYFMPSIHLTDLEVWSGSESCSQSSVIFHGKDERKLSIPVVTMDQPFKKAQSLKKWSDPGLITKTIYNSPSSRSAYFKSLLLTLSDGDEGLEGSSIGGFDHRIIYGIIGAILLIAAILMFIQVKTIIKYKRKKNFCGTNSSMINGSSANCYKNDQTNAGGQNQTYTDLTHSPLVQNTMASNQDPMSCCSIGSSTMNNKLHNNQPLFISPQTIQNNQFCGQVSPSSLQMGSDNFQSMCQHNNTSCMGTPMLMNNSNMMPQNAHSCHNNTNSNKSSAISPLMSSMQNRASPDMLQTRVMWTSQMQGAPYHQVIQGSNGNNPGCNSSKPSNSHFNRFGTSSLSSTSDLNTGNNSSLINKQYDLNGGNSFRGASPLNRQNNASPLTQSNNWNFNQLLPYSLPENPDGSGTGEGIKMMYTNSGLGSVGTCSDEGIGTASSPHHRYTSEFANVNNSISSSCGWSNLGQNGKFNTMLSNGTNQNDDPNRLICPPPMECLSTVKNSINSRNSSLKNSSTFRSDANEFSASILPPVQISSREHSVNSNVAPKSFMPPSDSSDVLVSMMGDVFEYETDTSRTNSISKIENFPAIPTNL